MLFSFLTSPKSYKLNCIVRFGFKASNNVVEYEVCLTGLKLVKEMLVKRLLINNDSQLVVNQVNGNFATRDNGMAACLKQVVDFILHFEKFELAHILNLENVHADALSKLASSKDSELLKVVPIQHIVKSSISNKENVI